MSEWINFFTSRYFLFALVSMFVGTTISVGFMGYESGETSFAGFIYFCGSFYSGFWLGRYRDKPEPPKPIEHSKPDGSLLKDLDDLVGYTGTGDLETSND